MVQQVHAHAKGVYCVGEHSQSIEDGKTKKILELELDVFIDDHPATVKHLREVLPGYVKVIQYEGRWIK